MATRQRGARKHQDAEGDKGGQQGQQRETWGVSIPELSCAIYPARGAWVVRFLAANVVGREREAGMSGCMEYTRSSELSLRRRYLSWKGSLAFSLLWDGSRRRLGAVIDLSVNPHVERGDATYQSRSCRGRCRRQCWRRRRRSARRQGNRGRVGHDTFKWAASARWTAALATVVHVLVVRAPAIIAEGVPSIFVAVGQWPPESGRCYWTVHQSAW